MCDSASFAPFTAMLDPQGGCEHGRRHVLLRDARLLCSQWKITVPGIGAEGVFIKPCVQLTRGATG